MKNKSTTNLNQQIDMSQISTYQAGVAQASMHRRLQKYCDDVLNQYGITKMHWLIIGTVLDSKQEGVRLTDLSEVLGTTMSYITGEVNLLEAKGMLSRKVNVKDSRSKLICINKSFAPKCTDIEATLRDALRSTIYADIDPVEFRIYMKVLFQLGNVSKDIK